MTAQIDNLATRTYHRLIPPVVVCVLFGAGVSIVGWTFDWPLAKAVLPGGVAMNPASALAFLASAFSLAILSQRQCSLSWRRVAQLLAGAVAVIGFLKVTSLLIGTHWGFDQWLFREKLGGNEMAPNTAVCFALTGMALLLLDVEAWRGHRPTQYLAITISLGAFLSLVGYTYGTKSMYGVESYVPMAINTAILFQLISLGILAARPQVGVAAIVTSPGIGGISARRLLVVGFVVPLLCGWLRLLGEQVGLYGSEFGVSLMVACNAIIFVTVALWTGAILGRFDGERQKADQSVRHMNEELEQRVERRTAELDATNRALQTEIDEHRRARKELAATNRDLMHKNQENEMFVYSVSHDLRSPLVNLQGFSNELREVCNNLRDILAANPMPEEIKNTALSLIDNDAAESVHFIQSAVMRLSNIIDALLRLSRVGRVEYQWQNVDTGLIVARIVDAMRATIGKQGASVSVARLPKLWGDPTALEQVFANLIGNSLKYSDSSRPGVIEVGWNEESREPGSATLYVRDNGLGIPETQRDKAFQAFQRLHPNIATGEGMGLAIVRRIVERHGGRSWIDDNANGGTIIYVTLPTTAESAPKRIRTSTANLERIENHAESVADYCAG